MVVFAWWICQPRADFVITTSRTGLRFRGRLAREQQRQIAQFFQNEFPASPRLRILGTLARNEPRLHLRFQGNLSPGERQRIRNFLLMVLF
jgi:hypothetical protein